MATARSNRSNTSLNGGTSEIYDRHPPCDKEAERGVLGSLLLDSAVCDEVVLVIRPDDFYDQAHQHLFEQMVAIHEDGQKIDPTLLVDRLKSAGQFEVTGGLAYLAELCNCVPTPANAKYYADIVRAKSILRSLIRAGTDIVRMSYEQEMGCDQLLSNAEQRIFSILEQRGIGEQSAIRDLLAEAMADIDARMTGEATNAGLETGFTDLDSLTGGLHESELIILAARPSMGKTALAMNIAENVTVTMGAPALFVSLEMSKLELAHRLLCSHAHVDSKRLRNGTIGNDERRKIFHSAAELSSVPLVVDDTPSRTVSEIAAVARRLKRKSGLGLIVIDYLQLIEPDSSSDPRQEQVARIARRLKRLARELEVPVMCLAQLNRQAEASRDNRPRLSHLRESGAIEQDADVVMFVHREEYYATTPEEKEQHAGRAEIIVSKQRNGPIGDVALTFLHQFTRFENAARPQYEEFGEVPFT